MNKIFNSIEDINKTYGVSLEIPEDIPSDCNVLCYVVEDLLSVELYDCYREDTKGFMYVTTDGNMVFQNKSLEDEIMWEERECPQSTYIYLRLIQQGDCEKTNFTPERLLGVLTDHGYIQDVGIRYITTTAFHSCEKEDLKFYISDDSDETVSFHEYVNMFYNTDNTL